MRLPEHGGGFDVEDLMMMSMMRPNLSMLISGSLELTRQLRFFVTTAENLPAVEAVIGEEAQLA
jgi:hypothetical protein